ncbi:Dynein regulatory complex subunit 5-like [Homarus americanus]|uniref:Dynein regulatory complex subunit 5-like n=1 Tax=Homarus americanus TaxID=6706 RepID=A0A8J5MMW3_HOMAM|nr:Dynein regulatory complex subunit 5-like [Homarus americanus]
MVEELRVLCLRVITENIDENTQLGRLTRRDLGEVCAVLSVDLPLPVALMLPLDDLYWRRRIQAHYPPPHLAFTAKGRRKGVHQKAARERVVTPQTKSGIGGGDMDGSSLITTTETVSHAHPLPRVTLCAPYIQALHLPSLARAPGSCDGPGVERGTFDHLNLADVITALPHIKDLSVRCQTVEEGGELCWADLGVSVQEAAVLSNAVATNPRITHLKVYESCVDDARADVLVGGLQGHQGLTYLDLSHNQLTCASVPSLIALLKSTRLASLHLQHNNIGEKGARQLGEALAQALHLQALLLDLNPLSRGGEAILEGATKGGRLRVLSLAGCRLRDQCWMPLAAALTSLPELRYVCLAANPFMQEPPAEVVKAAADGARILLTNLDGTTYMMGRVQGGRQLSPSLQALHDQLVVPLTPTAAQKDLEHYLPLHGLHLYPQDFTIEEELRGMFLFTKDPKNIL